MPRPGVSKQDVFAAANQLIGQGKDPTIEQVRQILKTGSNSTIAGHLRDWRATQSETQTVAVNEGLPHEMVGMMKGLWERLNVQADLKSDEIEEHYKTTITDLHQQLNKYKNNNRRWQKLFNQWQQDKEKLLTNKLTLEKKFESLLQDNTVLQTKVDVQIEMLVEKQAHIDELQRLLSQAQANLEHERTETKNQHISYQQQTNQYKQDINTLNNDLKINQEKMQSINQQLQLLQQRHHKLEHDHARLITTFDNEREKMIQLEKSCTAYQKESQHWEQQFKQRQNDLTSTNKLMIEHQTKINVLTQQLVDAKQALDEIHHLNKTITNEKWQLMQEKARLEGQLQRVSVTA